MFQPPEPVPEPAAQTPEYERLAGEMITALQAVRDLPALPLFAKTRKLPQAFFTHFNHFLDCYEQLIGLALENSGDDTRIECRKGCSNCCIDLVRGVSTPEMVNLYHHVRSWPEVRDLFHAHRDAAMSFMEILSEKVAGGPAPRGDDPRVAEAHIAYNQQNRPCAFLDQETGCCRIYEVRPIACRYFFSLDPPETCSPLHVKYLNREVRMVHLPPAIHTLLREINQRFGFALPNYLSGAFCELASVVMQTKPVEVEGP